jgi:hypothetical protein
VNILRPTIRVKQRLDPLYLLFILDRTPTEPKWWRALAHIHLQKNRYQPALTGLLVTGYLQPLSEQEMQLAADLYLQLGVPQKAAPLYETMLVNDNLKISPAPHQSGYRPATAGAAGKGTRRPRKILGEGDVSQNGNAEGRSAVYEW